MARADDKKESFRGKRTQIVNAQRGSLPMGGKISVFAARNGTGSVDKITGGSWKELLGGPPFHVGGARPNSVLIGGKRKEA